MLEKPFTLDRTVRLCIGIAIAIILFYLTRQLSSVLLPFVISWFISYLIHPIVNFVQHKLRVGNRTLSVILTLVFLIGVVALSIWALTGPVKTQISKATTLITAFVNGLSADTLLPEQWQDVVREWLANTDINSILTTDNIEKLINKITPYITGLLGGSISFISSLFIVFICVLYTIFILIDYDNISQGMRRMVPPKYRQTVNDLLNDLESGMNKYFRGQSLIALTVGILFAIGFSIMGLPLGIIVGLFIGLLNMIPYMQALGIPICIILGLLQSADTGTSYWIILIEIAAVFVVVQSIQDMLLNPLIMGNVIGMKPAVMLLALSIWGSLLGVAGMIIALPLTTVLISYYKRYILKESADSENADSQLRQVEPATSAEQVPASPTKEKRNK